MCNLLCDIALTYLLVTTLALCSILYHQYHQSTIRSSSFPQLADRFSACLRSLDLSFNDIELEKLPQCLTLLKQFTRLESLKLSVFPNFDHDPSLDPSVYVSTANLPSTLKRLHLDSVTMSIVDGPPIPSSASCLSSSAEPKVIPFPPQLEELRLVHVNPKISYVLHHMFPTTLVTLQLSKESLWGWDGSSYTYERDSEKETPKHELIKAMPQVKYLAIQWETMLPPDELFASLPSSLSWLFLQNQRLQDIHNLTLPPVWYQLRKLALTNSNLEDECIAALTGCTNLESLDLVLY